MPDLGDIAAAPGQPHAALDALAAALKADVGFDMMSVMVYDLAQMRGRRIYSTSATHPAGQFKTLLPTPWIDQVVERGEAFVADELVDFKPHYVDWPLLEQMGLNSAVNLPVRIDGRTAATLNLQSKQRAYYTADRLAEAERLFGLAALAVLLHAAAERDQPQP